MSDDFSCPNLELIIPEQPGLNPTEPFDWNEFLRENFKKIDGLQKFGSSRIINAGEYATLQLAINELDDDSGGGIVVMPPNIPYALAAPLVLYSDITLLGIGDATLTWATAPTSAKNMITIDGQAHITIDHLTMVGNDLYNDSIGTCYTTAIDIVDSSHITITNCSISAVKNGIVATSTVNGVVTDINIIDNIIEVYHNYGISLKDSRTVTVDHNIISATASTTHTSPSTRPLSAGISIEPILAILTYETVTVTNNIITSPPRLGIKIGADDGTTSLFTFKINNNEIISPQDTGTGCYGHLLTPTGISVIFPSTFYVPNIAIDDNTIVNVNGMGIVCENIIGYSISRNKVVCKESTSLTGQSGNGVYILHASNGIVDSNFISLAGLIAASNTALTFQIEGSGTRPRSAIDLHQADYTMVNNNRLWGGMYGVTFELSSYFTIIGNVISIDGMAAATTIPIHVLTATGIVIDSNMLRHTTGGNTVSIGIEGTNSNVMITNNTCVSGYISALLTTTNLVMENNTPSMGTSITGTSAAIDASSFNKKLFITSAAGAGVAIDLPAPSSAPIGTWIEFLSTTTGSMTGDLTFTVTGGALFIVGASTALKSTVTFVTNARIGAAVRFINNGTYWLVTNLSNNTMGSS